MARAIIVSGADVDSAFKTECDDFIICADSGYESALKLKIEPDILLGDMDSIKNIPSDIKKITFKAEKDETDTELALLYAKEQGFREVIILGALGGKRRDHSFANILLLKKAYDLGINAKLYSENEQVYILCGKHCIVKKENMFLSLFPVFEDVTITLKGTKYPLCKEKIPAGSIRGISNEIVDEKAKIETDRCVLVFETRKDY